MKEKVFTFLLVVNTLFVFSNQINVVQDGSGDYTIIQEAINASSDGDTIIVHPGTYFENINFSGKNICLAGLGLITGDDSYKYNTIIDGNNTGSAIIINSGESDVLIYGLKIQHGSGNIDSVSLFISGGGVFLKNASAKISNCIIIENKVPYGHGGGIIVKYSSLTLDDCIIKNNFSESGGGGIYCSLFSTVNISGTSISHNYTHSSGGGLAIGYESFINYDTINLNSLYLNFASRGNDLIFANQEETYYLKLDTFTVAVPTPYFVSLPDIHGYEKEDLVLDAQHAAIEPFYGDLYVNPLTGNDNNIGNTKDNPLKTIAFAVTKIGLDSIKKRNIYLANGIYSDSANNEKFPINIRPRINFIGESMKAVIFDGEYTTSLIEGHNEVSDYSFQKITFQRGRKVNYDMTILNREPFGVLYFENENVLLDSLTFKDAITDAGEKGFAIRNSGNTILSNSIFENVKGDRALHIATWNTGDTARVQNCKFYFNKRDINNPDHNSGGGLVAGGANGVIIVNNSLFENNDTDALLATDGQLFVSNCTFVGNSKEFMSTAAIYDRGSTMHLFNSIQYDNGPTPIWVSPSDNYSSELYIYNSLIENGLNSITLKEDSYLYYDSTNIDSDPIFLGMWDDPYMISDNSPCIDAGSLAKLPSFIQMPDYDLAGNPRVYGDSIDMGAYEWNPTIVGFNEVGPQKNKRSLLKASPNPFDWGTYIEVEGKVEKHYQSKEIKVDIYDNYGRLVRNILSGKINENTKILWYGDDNNGNKLPSGIYHIILFNGDKEVQSLKVVKR